MKNNGDLPLKFVKECAKFRALIEELASSIEKEEEENTQIISPNPFVSLLHKLKDEILIVEDDFREIL